MLLTSKVNKLTIFKESGIEIDVRPELNWQNARRSADLLLEGGENDANSSLQ
jgi:hypothetical protein